MKILLTERHITEETPISLQNAGLEVFSPKEEIPGVHEFDRSALLATLKNIQPDILLTGFKFKIDREILDSAPIKLVATRTTGLDHIDLNYCKEKGIEIISLRGSDLSDIRAVPELCLWAMLELVRKRDGRELNGKTLGIIGMGRIGNLLEGMLADDYYLGIKTLHYDIKYPHFNLEELLKTSDIVSLHITSDESNRNFMDKEKFEMMKDGSYFLNSARGWLVDEPALKWALESDKLAKAWSDFPVSFKHPNLLITNHIGGKTLESSIKTEKIIVEKIIQWSK